MTSTPPEGQEPTDQQDQPDQPEAGAQTAGQQSDGDGQEPKTFDKAYVEQLRRESAAARAANKKLQKDLDAAAAKAMSDSERAVHDAKAEGRKEALGQVGQRLAKAELKAAAATAGVVLDEETLADLNLSLYVDEDGEPDSARIDKTVKRFKALQGAPQSTNFDGGPRQSTGPATNMNDWIRQQAGIRPQ